MSKFETICVTLFLEACFNLDQAGRKIASNNRNPGIKRFASILQQQIDKGLRISLSLCLNRYGWITRSRFGEKAATTAFLIVQHAPKSYLEKHIPLLRDAACAGEARRDHLAMMQDRLLMYRGKKQLYGTQFTRDFGATEQKPWPIVNIKTIDARRRKMDFSRTFAEYDDLMRGVG